MTSCYLDFLQQLSSKVERRHSLDKWWVVQFHLERWTEEGKNGKKEPLQTLLWTPGEGCFPPEKWKWETLLCPGCALNSNPAECCLHYCPMPIWTSFLPASLLSCTEEKGGSSSSSLYPVGICLACAQSQSELIAKEDVLLIPAWLSTHQWTDDTTHIYMCIPRDSCLLVSSDPKAKPVFVFASS